MRSNASEVIKRLTDKLNRVKREVPKILANEGQKLFNENFRSQTFEANKWENVKRREPGTFEYKYPKKLYLARRTNPILVGKTRRLKNAVNRAVKSANINRITWGVGGSEGKYGYFHNFGIGQKKRTFMAADFVLRRRLKAKYLQIVRNNIR